MISKETLSDYSVSYYMSWIEVCLYKSRCSLLDGVFLDSS